MRGNNITAVTELGVTTNDGGAILNNVGEPDNTFPGTNPDMQRFYHVYQLSADYRISPQLRVGALYGIMDDRSDANNDVNGANVGAYYDLSRRTTQVGIVHRF